MYDLKPGDENILRRSHSIVNETMIKSEPQIPQINKRINSFSFDRSVEILRA